jgi:hypothetical protein
MAAAATMAIKVIENAKMASANDVICSSLSWDCIGTTHSFVSETLMERCIIIVFNLLTIQIRQVECFHKGYTVV